MIPLSAAGETRGETGKHGAEYIGKRFRECLQTLSALSDYLADV